MAMTDYDVFAICRERLARWTEILVKTHSTPMMLVAVGHDQGSGQISVIAVEQLTNEEIFNCLVKEAAGIEGA
jgi:hypothetical protein